MYLTQKNNLRNLDKETYEILVKLSSLSKNIYNVGVYNIRKNYFNNGTISNFYDIYKVCKQNENYPLLVACAQATLLTVDATFKSFLGLLKLKKQGKYDAKVKLPGYLPKDGYHPITWVSTGIKIIDGQIRLSMTREFKKQFNISKDYLYFPLPKNVEGKKIQQVKIKPSYKAKSFSIHITYKEDIKEHELDSSEFLAIDLGVNNFASCISTLGTSFILDGRRIKSINQKWNKEVARLKSILDKQEPNSKRYSHQLYRLTIKRNNRVREFINQSINHIVKYCIKHKIGNIVIGDFKDLQNSSNMGRINNQNFCQIPFGQFKSKLEAKCQQHQINLIRQEETFTSLCSFMDKEQVGEKVTYLGRRLKRGLFRTKERKFVNADLNAACNIFAKWCESSKQNLEDYFERLCTGLINSPLRIRLLGPSKTSQQTMRACLHSI